MENIELRFPNENDREIMQEYLQEHYNNNEYQLNGTGGAERLDNFDEWLKKIKDDLSRETVKKGRVPATLYLAIRKLDNKLIGTIQIRHELNEYLLQYGGNIGYGVRPSERKKGYAKEMLRLALEKSKQLGIKKVLLTCDKDNEGSRKVIIGNNGKLENEIDNNGIIVQRYWIEI